MPLLFITSVAVSLVVLGADGTSAREIKDGRSNHRLLDPVPAIYLHWYEEVKGGALKGSSGLSVSSVTKTVQLLTAEVLLPFHHPQLLICKYRQHLH